MNKINNWLSIDIRSFLTITILFSILAGGGLYSMYTTDSLAIERSRNLTESIQNRMISKSVTMDLKDLFIDLQLVANHVEVRAFMSTRDTVARENVEKEFLSLCSISTAYDQVRILDNSGMELVRVNYNNGKPAAVPQEKLQNKGNRYYFKESIILPAGKVYVSPFDLNVEKGQIEQPLKPMLRVCMPVFDDNRKRLGVVILNYLGQQILDNILDSTEEDIHTMLLNMDGYWLLSPVKSQEWAFMYDDRKSESFAALHPDVWKMIQNTPSGQFYTEDGEFTFSTVTVSPKADSTEAGLVRKWKIVDLAPMSEIKAALHPLQSNYLKIYLGIVLIVAFGSFMRARFVYSREQGRIRLKAARLEAENANRAKSDFLAKMSHEIRTPMNAIIGLTHLALKTELSAKQNDYLTKVSSSAKSLLTIINDILDLSKIEADRLDLEHIDFVLDDVLNTTVNMLGMQAEQKGLEFLLFVKSSVPNLLVGDPLRLGQILLNITGNAIKFTESGEVIISAELIEEKDGKAEIRFAITDTGIGISQEQIDKLFQPFSQADDSTTRNFGGTGLGLVICKRLVEMMGGEIKLVSEQGKGSEFTFTIPFVLQAKHMGEHQICPVPIRGMRVLVVDDSKMSRFVLTSVLESFSFTVNSASHGEEALELLHESDSINPFRLVITDWRMPDIDGLELNERIKERGVLQHPPKVIMLTAYGQDEIHYRVKQSSLDGFMMKPFNRSILFDTIMNSFGAAQNKSKMTGALRKREGVPANVAGAKVLLTEDNEVNQLVAKEILEGANIVVEIADNGQKALDMLASGTYDIVLMDIQMPVMDGFQAVRIIRSTPDFKDIPVVAMTAHALVGDKEKSLLAGMNDHITKPIDPDILMETLSKWLPRKEDQPSESSASSESSEQRQPRPPQDQPFTNLPGINSQDGLARIRGNEALYAKLLTSFANDCEGEQEQLDTMLAAGNFKDAASVAHRLKGVAGNIGADNLFQTVAQIEAVLKQDQKPSQQLLGEFESEIMLVAGGIHEAFPQSEKETCSAQFINTAEAMKHKPRLEELSTLLERRDFEARTLLETLKPILAGIAPGFTSELEDLLGKFDFAGGHERIKTFLAECEKAENENG